MAGLSCPVQERRAFSRQGEEQKVQDPQPLFDRETRAAPSLNRGDWGHASVRLLPFHATVIDETKVWNPHSGLRNLETGGDTVSSCSFLVCEQRRMGDLA